MIRLSLPAFKWQQVPCIPVRFGKGQQPFHIPYVPQGCKGLTLDALGMTTNQRTTVLGMGMFASFSATFFALCRRHLAPRATEARAGAKRSHHPLQAGQRLCGRHKQYSGGAPQDRQDTPDQGSPAGTDGYVGRSGCRRTRLARGACTSDCSLCGHGHPPVPCNCVRNFQTANTALVCCTATAVHRSPDCQRHAVRRHIWTSTGVPPEPAP